MACDRWWNRASDAVVSRDGAWHSVMNMKYLVKQARQTAGSYGIAGGQFSNLKKAEAPSRFEREAPESAPQNLPKR